MIDPTLRGKIMQLAIWQIHHETMVDRAVPSGGSGERAALLEMKKKGLSKKVLWNPEASWVHIKKLATLASFSERQMFGIQAKAVIHAQKGVFLVRFKHYGFVAVGAAQSAGWDGNHGHKLYLQSITAMKRTPWRTSWWYDMHMYMYHKWTDYI